ncbi:MAG: hypothetical protein IJ199_01270 [Prevotella sp.]|nr:hypothetical protein [Prevotella sp.]
MKHHTLILTMTLLTAVALATSCSNEESIADGGTIPFTATLAPKSDNGSQTRAITTGTDADDKEVISTAWEVNEKISLYYQTASGYAKTTAKVTEVNDGVATISATLDATATDGGTVKLVYPASLANETGDDIDESKLMTQYGLLTNHAYSISKRYDAATGEGKISLSGGIILPTSATITNTEGTDDVSLKNCVCICKFHLSVYTIGQYGTLTTLDGPMNDDLTINDGNGHTYTIKSQKEWPGGLAPDGGGEHPGFQTGDDIYVAILPITSKSLTLSATADIESVTKTHTLTTKPGTLAAGKFYRNVPVALQLENLEITGNVTQTLTVPDGMTIIVNNANIDITDAPAIVLGDKSKLILMGTNTVRATYADAIQCNGNATIEFQSTTNTITAAANANKAIRIADGKSVNITGTGSASLTRGIGVGSNATLKMDGEAVNPNIWIPDGATLKSTGVTCNSTVTIDKGATVRIWNMTVNVTSGPGIKCSGDATIILDGTNSVKTTADYYPAIQAGDSGTTLTIQGSGSVTASGANWGAGIGGKYEQNCGNIEIQSGNIIAKGGSFSAGIGSAFGMNSFCGNITISGGTIESTGGYNAACIGAGDTSNCGNITITGDKTRIKVTKDRDAPCSIGKGHDSISSDGELFYASACGTVTIGGIVYANGVTESPFLWHWPTE